jgi:hypothetical protein
VSRPRKAGRGTAGNPGLERPAAMS